MYWIEWDKSITQFSIFSFFFFFFWDLTSDICELHTHTLTHFFIRFCLNFNEYLNSKSTRNLNVSPCLNVWPFDRLFVAWCKLLVIYRCNLARIYVLVTKKKIWKNRKKKLFYNPSSSLNMGYKDVIWHDYNYYYIRGEKLIKSDKHFFLNLSFSRKSYFKWRREIWKCNLARIWIH